MSQPVQLDPAAVLDEIRNLSPLGEQMVLTAMYAVRCKGLEEQVAYLETLTKPAETVAD